jgi:hypothetical protein
MGEHKFKNLTSGRPPEAKTIQHYYMIAGEIVFTAAGNDIPNVVRCNCVVMSDTGKIAVQQLAKAQQTLQGQFFQKLGDLGRGANVVDVVILSIMPLGEFTHEEFNKLPDGMKLQERKEPVVGVKVFHDIEPTNTDIA